MLFCYDKILSVSFETVNHATTLHRLQLKLDLNVSGCSHALQVALSSSWFHLLLDDMQFYTAFECDDSELCQAR